MRTRTDDTSAYRETVYAYDANNRVTAIAHPSGLGSEYFQYDVLGNLVAKKDGNGAVTAYEYDNLGRLVRVKYGYGSNAWPANATYPLSTPCIGRLRKGHTSLHA